MNSNKKHKSKNKQNKPPNSSQSEKSEITVESEKEKLTIENVEQVTSVEEIKEVVPENLDKDLEPKKPKRNKNKKKKPSDDDLTEKDLDVNPTDIPEVIKENTKTDVLEKAPDEPIITPTARKKNKNKKQEVVIQPTDKLEISATIVKNEEQTGTQTIAVLPVSIKDEKSEQDKVQKKKNKKKKRHDSERSEKADEVISCTAAFQMLLDVKTEKKDNVKDVSSLTTESKLEQKLPVSTTEPMLKKTKTEEITTKKKSKKGKNKEEIDSQVKESEMQVVTLKGKPLPPKSEEKLNIVCSEETAVIQSEEKGTSETPKAKAEIAKPVERKQKHKPEEQPNKSEMIVSKAVTTDEAMECKKSVSLGDILFGDKKTTKDASFDQKQVTKDSEKEEEKPAIPPTDIAEPVKKPQTVSKDEKNTQTKQTKSERITVSTESPVEIKTAELLDNSPQGDDDSFVMPSLLDITEEDIKKVEEKPVIKPLIVSKGEKKSHTKQTKSSEKNIESTEKLPVEIKTSETLDQSPPSNEDTFVIPSLLEISKEEHKKVEEKPITKPHIVTKGEKKSHTKQTKSSEKNIESTEKLPVKIKTFETLDQSPSSNEETFVISSLLEITKEEHIKVEEKPILQETISKSIDALEVDLPIQTSDPIENTVTVDDLQVPSNQRKKRKKSPKPPPKTDSVIVLQDIPPTEQTRANIESEEDIQMKSENQSASIKLQKTKSTDEISKPQIQTDTETKSDVTPDSIQYPRSMSHQTSDSNNNTFIQEIRTPEQAQLNIPIVIPETPLIKGSGETPDDPPKLEISELKIMEVKPMPTTEQPKEKTDLKSKVLEVNQDMEDLRLSIERSLAELTLLENKENETEKIYRDKCITSAFEAEASKVNPFIVELKPEDIQLPLKTQASCEIPITPPPRQDNKGKGKSKKKNKHENQQATSQSTSTTQTQEASASATSKPTESKDSKDDKKENKSEQKQSETAPEKSKQQSDTIETHNAASESSETERKNGDNLYSTMSKDHKQKKDNIEKPIDSLRGDFEPIENFEDAMTSSLDDVNKTFEIIANNSSNGESISNPQISVTVPEEERIKRDVKEKINPVSQPKNLLGHPDIPVPSNRTDYKKERNRPPNTRQAKVKIKDAVDIEPKSKINQESQTDSKGKFFKKDTTVEESVTCVTNENEEYVYKYSFRKVFLPNMCHICKKELKTTKVPCNYCSLIFYCSNKHKDEGWSQHQALCFAVSTVAHHKNQKHIYADSKGLSGQAYRLFRMQLIVACEKVLTRKLVPWEQEAILYPSICADVNCREYRQAKLKDCDGCGQISYCSEDHLPKSHQKWCKSYSLYQKLVYHQQTQGRLAPKLPTRVLSQQTQLPDKINMVLATLYEEKIDMNDIQYASLTQIATAPLTAAYSYQIYNKSTDVARIDKNFFTIHIVNAELQYEADALNKWESLFLHLHPQINELRIVLTGTELNPGGLPLELLGKVKLCANCRLHARKLNFAFQDSHTYAEYWDSNDFLTPDIVCAFNPSIQRATIYNGKDQWPLTINTIFKLKSPFLITSYTMNELNRDLNRIKECSKIDFKVISKANFNPFASVRPDRNFITDDEIPLLFKNYCFAVLCGV